MLWVVWQLWVLCLIPTQSWFDFSAMCPGMDPEVVRRRTPQDKGWIVNTRYVVATWDELLKAAAGFWRPPAGFQRGMLMML